MNSPSYCLQKMLWQYTYEIYINTLIAIIYFLSKHHLQGGDREQHSKTIALVISIHTTRKVVTFTTCINTAPVRFQSTPPARWWLPPVGIVVSSLQISIHTTRKVVTWAAGWVYGRVRISIHTTRKVVTMSGNRQRKSLKFQSTPPARWWR